MKKSIHGILRLVSTTNSLYKGVLIRERTSGLLTVHNQKELYNERFEFIAPLIITDDALEAYCNALLPSGEIVLMEHKDMLNYLAAESNATKRIAVMPSEFRLSDLAAICDGTIKNGDCIVFEYIDNQTTTLAPADPITIVAAYEQIKRRYPIPNPPVNRIDMNLAGTAINIIGDDRIQSIQLNGKEMITEEDAKDLCKKAIWDYIKNAHELTNTSYATGVSCEIKSHSDTNIDAWWNKQKEQTK